MEFSLQLGSLDSNLQGAQTCHLSPPTWSQVWSGASGGNGRGACLLPWRGSCSKAARWWTRLWPQVPNIPICLSANSSWKTLLPTACLLQRPIPAWICLQPVWRAGCHKINTIWKLWNSNWLLATTEKLWKAAIESVKLCTLPDNSVLTWGAKFGVGNLFAGRNKKIRIFSRLVPGKRQKMNPFVLAAPNILLPRLIWRVSTARFSCVC